MDNYHEAGRHLTYLRQSLSQDKKNIGFFMSAGCPLAISMPKDEGPLIPDIKGLTQWLNGELSGNKKYKHLLVELTKADQSTDNVENILSFTRGLLQVAKGNNVRGLSEDELLSLEKDICEKIIEKVSVTLPDQDTPYHKLVNWISSIDREFPIEIFTTNYDILIEQALENIGQSYFDGFVGVKNAFFDLRTIEDDSAPKHWTRLWKLHGSINWRQINTGSSKQVYRTSEINEGASTLIYPSHLKYEQSRKMPYLALSDQLSKFIRKKSSLLIISGYSFRDEHLNDTIINALKSNPTAMALGLMYDSYSFKDEAGKDIERYPKAYQLAQRQHNLNIWTFDKAIIGTNLRKWNKSNVHMDDSLVKNFVESKIKVEGQPDEEISIKLGDFSVFSEFLKTLIGTEKERQNDNQ